MEKMLGVKHSLFFQYPRSDRRRCNRRAGRRSRSRSRLSVSSVGSEAMQHKKSALAAELRATFSILGRIGGDATPNPCAGYRCFPALSVSSVGSEAMQLILFFVFVLREARLSVSSVGSEAMQQQDRKADFSNYFDSFSILGRIGGDATTSATHTCQSRSNFQYPRSDRRRCNATGGVSIRFLCRNFQYPRSDRRRCNYYTSTCLIHKTRTFSILGRIGGDATTDADSHTNAGADFQYPRSDRRRCNF